jgi:carbon monoxide dehydrogenase subunit G
MAKFPTEVERSITVKAPLEKVYKYLWDVVGSSKCIPGLAKCKRVSAETYRFLYKERSAGPVSMSIQYTAHYETDGKSTISFASAAGEGDNTDVDGQIRLQKSGADATKITLRQKLAPDTPVPTLLQGVLRSFVQKEASSAAAQYLDNVKHALEGAKKA